MPERHKTLFLSCCVKDLHPVPYAALVDCMLSSAEGCCV